MGNLQTLLENFGWVWGGIAFLVLSTLVIFTLKKIYEFFSAIFISRKILKNNRVIKGRAPGTRSADIFIALWYEEKNIEEVFNESYQTGPGCRASCPRRLGDVVEHNLSPMGLAEIFEDHTNRIKKARAIKNFRNRLVLVLTKFLLKRNENLFKFQSYKAKSVVRGRFFVG